MPGSITGLVQAWQESGDSDAATDLDARLHAHLLAVVRQRRGQKNRRRIDSEGIVNNALGQFFLGVRDGKYPDLENRQQIKSLLLKILLRALFDAGRYHARIKRNAHRDVSLDNVEPHELTDAGQQTPLENCIEAESLEKLPEFQRNLIDTVRDVHPLAIEIMELSLVGCSNIDIADRLKKSLRSVQQIKQKMREVLQEKLHGNSGPDHFRRG